MFMTKKPGYWLLVGTYNSETYSDEHRAADKFAAMVAAHNFSHCENEKIILAAIAKGKRNIRWDAKSGFEY